jgi:ATP-dependent DNA helicase DinG
VIESLCSLGSFTTEEDEPELANVIKRANEIAAELDFIQKAESKDHVYWAEARGRGLFLRSCPIEVADELQKRLYPRVDSMVFTSATLTADGRFDFFARRMGLSGSTAAAELAVQRLSVPSPFDFPNQAALYLPSHLPDPQDPGFVEAVSEEIVRLCEITGGRAFALFTSLRNMQSAYELCQDRLPCRALLQGERPKSQLLEQFREEPSVLFASHSFWEGVDVQGDFSGRPVGGRPDRAAPWTRRRAVRCLSAAARGDRAASGIRPAHSQPGRQRDRGHPR